MISSLVLALALTQAGPRFTLRWNVPCAEAPDVETLLGPVEGEAAVTVTSVESHWHLEVAFVTPASGARELDAHSCEEAAQAALLFLKLGATPPEAPRVVAPSAEPPRPPVAEAPAKLEVRLDVAGLGNVGALPLVTGRFAATVGVGSGTLAGFASLRAGAPRSFSTTAQFWVHPALGLQLSACFLPRLGRVRVGPCVAVVVEWWRASGLDVTAPRENSEVWLAVGADARLQVDLFRGLYAFALAGPRVSIRRPQIVFETTGVAFTVPTVSGEGAIGLGWRW